MIIRKIGLDFHGVINTDPEFFRDFSVAAGKRDIEVHIISGGPKKEITEYLIKHNIPYNQIWCIFDYYHHKDKVRFLPDGSFHVDDILWNKAKATYCRNKKIDIHIDDSNIYGCYFTSPYCRYDANLKLCKLGRSDIDFKHLPEQVLDELLTLSTKNPD